MNDTLNFYVSIEDEVKDAPVGGNNLVKILNTVIILDENDNAPVFEGVSLFERQFRTIVLLTAAFLNLKRYPTT